MKPNSTRMKLLNSFVVALLYILKYSTAQIHNTPPVLVAVPRTLQLPLDTKVGTVVCRVKANDHDGDEVDFSIGPSPSVQLGRLPFKDGFPFFKISRRGKEGVVTLAASLKDQLKVGDQLTLSVSGVDGVSGITTRTEIPIFIEEPIHDSDEDSGESDTVATTTSTASTITSSANVKPATTTSSKSTTTSSSSSSSTTSGAKAGSDVPIGGQEQLQNPDPGDESVSEKTKEEMAAERSKKYILTLVPIFIVCPTLGVIGFFLRHRLVSLAKRCCGKSNQQQDEKDVSKIESADGEFKMATDFRKISTNSYGFSPKAGIVNSLPILPDDDRWEFPRHQLKILTKLGEGSFGQVWKCEAENIDGDKGTTIVAMKTLKQESSTEKKDLLQELSVMKMLDSHPNVVRLLGCCTDKDPIFVIIEYISGGTLQDFLRKSRSEHNYKNLHGESQTLSARDLTSYAYQIAKGMAYLSSKKVIHRDLAARNILVTFDDPMNKNSCVCKICDFGFARDVMANNIYEKKSDGKVPIRWMAPETLYDNCYTTKSDVWSFGILLWEIVTLGSTPYPGMSSSEVMKKIRDGYRLEKPEHCKREIYNIMYYCWNKNPEDRPSFSALVQDFESLLGKESDYIDLNMFPEHAYYNELSLSGEKV